MPLNQSGVARSTNSTVSHRAVSSTSKIIAFISFLVKRRAKLCFTVLLSSGLILLVLFFYLRIGENSRETLQAHVNVELHNFSPPNNHDDHSKLVKETMACKLPKLQPFDPTVKAFVEAPEEIVCEDDFYPLLFEMQGHSTLVTVKDPSLFGFDKCCFSEVVRASQDNEVTIANECEHIEGNRTVIPSPIETFIVSCWNSTMTNMVDLDIFSVPRIPPQEPRSLKGGMENLSQSYLSSKAIPETPNVLVLGLDAISHMNFQRTMPKTHEYLSDNLSAFYFNGHTKVGDNTFPNILPVLTGHSMEEIKGSCWTSENDYFDNCPFIWKDFSRRGYITVLGEDAPAMSTFNYFKNGFKDPPVHLYLRPMFISQDRFIGHADLLNSNLCYGPRPTFQVAFDYIQRFASFMKTSSRPYFLFQWVNAMFHDFLNSPALGDEPLLHLLTWMQGEKILDNTVVILMSDHGMRWGDIRETLQGQIEERMPFLYVLLPSTFEREHSRALHNMRGNRDAFTTHFDLHETLLDLLFKDTRLSEHALEERETKMRQGNALPRGISLFLPVPSSRTCKDADVNEHWCVCNSMTPVEDAGSDPRVKEGARVVVDYINTKLQAESKCAQLKLKEILRAQYQMDEKNSGINSNLRGGNFSSQGGNNPNISGTLFEITLKTTPGLAVFEVSVFRDGNGDWRVSGGISRTNMYGKQSRCVKDTLLKILCFCI